MRNSGSAFKPYSNARKRTKGTAKTSTNSLARIDPTVAPPL